ncbi:uncharacterized protein LOC142317835 [Lycorma delicatula]|uniref:uncharacterized protein LOC142317835 n=1 Tax=Lycorma delicatula TaxID=130591 RepID=UPI003F5135F9
MKRRRAYNQLEVADGTTLFRGTEVELKEILNRIQQESESQGLKCNIGKTKVMIVDRANDLRVSDVLCDSKRKIISYIQHTNKEGGDSSAEIQRILLVKEAFTKLTAIWKDRAITRNTKLSLFLVQLLQVIVNGIDNSIIKVEDQRRMHLKCELTEKCSVFHGKKKDDEQLDYKQKIASRI